MKNVSAVTILATLAIASIAIAGIEVLSITTPGIEVLEGGPVRVTTLSVAPEGSTVDAVMNMGGALMVVDTQPVCPMTGCAIVHFPFDDPNNQVTVTTPGGLTASGYVGGDSHE